MARKTYHHGNLREALLDAARDILSDDGVEGLSVRKVAQRAGVSATAPYSHFRDKRELLAVLVTRGFEELAGCMEREVDAARDMAGGDDLIALARGYVAFATANPSLFQLMFGPGLGDLMDFPELAAASARAYGLMEGDVARRMEQAGTPERTSIAVAGAWSLVHGLSTLLNDGRVVAGECGLADNAALVEGVCGLLRFAAPLDSQ
jgi:AcrR family transcriptional regulator